MDVNVYQENIFHTKMMLKDLDLGHHLFDTKPKQFNHEEKEDIICKLHDEIKEIYYGRNLSKL